MLQEACEFFNRFYLITLKEHISDPVLHSEWNYFLSMFKTNSLEKERIELYLSILQTEKTKNKQPHKHILPYTEPFKPKPQTKIQLVSSQDNHFDILHDLKLQKRYSQNWKTSITNQPKTSKEIIKLMPQPFSLKHKTSEDEVSKNKSIDKQSNKATRIKSDSIYTNTSFANTYTYFRPQSPTLKDSQARQNKLKERHKRLCQISQRVVNVFEGVKLRA